LGRKLSQFFLFFWFGPAGKTEVFSGENYYSKFNYRFFIRKNVMQHGKGHPNEPKEEMFAMIIFAKLFFPEKTSVFPAGQNKKKRKIGTIFCPKGGLAEI
jgi:hypothetical protein